MLGIQSKIIVQEKKQEKATFKERASERKKSVKIDRERQNDVAAKKDILVMVPCAGSYFVNLVQCRVTWGRGNLIKELSLSDWLMVMSVRGSFLIVN